MDKELYVSKSKLLGFLGIRENFLYGDYTRKYLYSEIPKANGGKRVIKSPNKKLKEVQEKVLSLLCEQTKLNESTFGLSGLKGVLHNVEMHRANCDTKLVTLDVANFFDSVTRRKVKSIFLKIGFSTECSALLTKICTIDETIPQGAPTSPLLSALSLQNVDKEVFYYCSQAGLIYSRYFDDVTVSGDRLNPRIITSIVCMFEKRGFSMRDDKRCFYTSGVAKVITGVVLTDRGLDVTEKYKAKIKSAWYNYCLSPRMGSWNVFIGCMSFYLYINRPAALNFFKSLTGVDFSEREVLAN